MDKRAAEIEKLLNKLESCSCGHEEVYYDKHCPVCEAEEEIDRLQREVEAIRKEAETEIDRLLRDVVALEEAKKELEKKE